MPTSGDRDLILVIDRQNLADVATTVRQAARSVARRIADTVSSG